MADEIGYVTEGLPGWNSLGEDAHETNPALVYPMSLEVYDQMRREDAQVASVMRAVNTPIRASRWEIDPAGARPEVVQLVAEDLGLAVKGQEAPARPLRTRGRFSWDEFLRLALLELVYGHSVFEQVYLVDDSGRTRIRKLAWRPPRTISKFDVAKDGGLVAIEQWGIGAAGTVRIPVDRLVVFVNDREGASWIGQSLLRQAYRPWLLKDRFLRVEVMAAERNGLGVPTYTGAPVPDAYANDDEKAIQWMEDQEQHGIQIAQDFRAGENAGVYMPHGASLDLLGVKGKLPDMDGPIRRHNEEIANAVLAQVLNLGGDKSTGSYALSDTFADILTGALNAIMTHIADVTQQHVVEDLVDVNWGPNEPAPRIVPAPLGKEQPITAEAIRALVECGALAADPELEKDLRARYGLPAPAPAAEPNGSDAETALAAAEVAQKVYLASDKVPLNQQEARELIRRAGANLTGDGPDIQRVPDARPAEEAAA